MKNFKTSDIIKNLVRTFCITILCGIVILAFMLLLVKHTEVCELIFSGAGFACVALVVGLVVGFLVGYFKCFFKATKAIDDLAASRNSLKSKYLENRARLYAYEQQFKELSTKDTHRNRSDLLRAIVDFPIDDDDPVAPTEESAD